MIIVCLVAMVVAIGLDLASLWLLIQTQGSAAPPAGFGSLHGSACAIAALAFRSLLPAIYRQPVWAAWLFCFIIALCIPLLGLLGLVLGLVPALWSQRPPARRFEYLHSTVATLLDRAIYQRHAAPVSDGRLMSVLLSTADHSSRLRALTETLPLEDQHAVPLLRTGLKDRDDDVRLLAYSLLMRKEKALEGRIFDSLGRLDDATGAVAFVSHRALACDYWELARIGGSGSANLFLLDRARTHALAGLMLQPKEASLQLFLGRILLEEQQFAPARSALLRAVAGGVALEKAAPFLAEIAFNLHEFRQIGPLLQFKKSAASRSTLHQLFTYWNGTRHAD